MSEIITDTRAAFRPTLIVGLGGTGHEVVVRLKARFLDTFGPEVFRIIKLLVFDTADEGITVNTARGEPVSLDKGTELINIGHVPTSGIIKHLDRHPAIAAWLPDELPARAITAGAQQVRPMGRLALFYHFEGAVRPRLEQAIRDLSNIRLAGATIGEQGQIARSQGINAFVITSVCGGTGSGIFLDMAYLMRHFAVINGVREEFCFINGVVVLPQAFATVASDAIKANSYAALQELDYFMEGGRFTVDYPGGTRVDQVRSPFSICYLVDAVNEQGKMLAGLSELAPMIAESIFLQTSSQVGEATKSVFDNVKALTGMDYGHVTAYSGVGTATLAFPASVLIEACATRLGADVISEISPALNSPQWADRAWIRDITDAFMDDLQLLSDSLMAKIAVDPRNRPIRIHLESSASEGIKDTDIPPRVERLVQEYDSHYLNGVYRQIMEENRDRLQAELVTALSDRTQRLVDDPARGLVLALGFLDDLAGRLDELRYDLDHQREEIQERLKSSEGRIVESYAELGRAVKSLPFGKKGRIKKARDSYLLLQQNRLTTKFQILQRDLTLGILAALSTQTDRELAKLRALADKLTEARDKLARRAAELAEGRSRALNPLTHELTSANDVDKYYTQYVPDVKQKVTGLLSKMNGLYAWAGGGSEELHDVILEFGRVTFAPLREVRIEDVIRDKQAEVTAAERLEQLREDSVPFWNYDPTLMTDSGVNVESIIVIGVEDAARSLFGHETRRGEMLTSTRDAQRITVLCTRHGLTIYALQQFEDYKRRYEAHRQRKVSPLHIFDLGDPRWARTIFAVGEALGLVEELGAANYYYHTDADERADLARGLEAALRAFAANPEAVTMVERAVDGYIGEVGKSAARETIETYLAQELAAAPDRRALEQELRDLAREYMERYL